MSEAETIAIQFIRLSEVLMITGLSKTGLYEAISRGEFKKPVKISNRCSAWVKEEVQDWCQSKINARSEGVR